MKIKAIKPVMFLCATLVLVSLACSVDLYGTPTPAPSTEAAVQPEQLTATLPPEQSTTTFTNSFMQPPPSRTDGT
mgnify:CR=1 FL=1